MGSEWCVGRTTRRRTGIVGPRECEAVNAGAPVSTQISFPRRPESGHESPPEVDEGERSDRKERQIEGEVLYRTEGSRGGSGEERADGREVLSGSGKKGKIN